MAGKLIVFEGIDGSGKSTQVKLFGADQKLSFPRYDTLAGKLIRLIYTQKWASRISPYVTAWLFAFDRFLAKPLINRWLESGQTVAIDRYTYSSMAHQGAKFVRSAKYDVRSKKHRKPRTPNLELRTFLDWIDWLENKLFKLPQADKVIYLKVPARISKKLMRSRRKDLAEADYIYQQKTARVYLALAKKYKFVIINCLDKQKRLLSKDDVSQKITAAIG